MRGTACPGAGTSGSAAEAPPQGPLQASLRLSVIIPTRDRPLLLRQAVASALTALPFGQGEVIVIDDHSKRPATNVLADMAVPQLRTALNMKLPGPAGARNSGVSMAGGNVVMFLDDDDLLVPGYADWAMKFTAANPTFQFGFSCIHRFTDGQAPDLTQIYRSARGTRIRDLPFRRQITGLGCGFWIKRTLFQSLGGLSESIAVNEDTDFLIRLLSCGAEGWRADAPGVYVRRHRSGSSNGVLGSLTNRANAEARADYFKMILDRNADWLSNQRGARKHMVRRLLKMQAKAGLVSQGRGTLNSKAASGLRLGPYFWGNVLFYRMLR